MPRGSLTLALEPPDAGARGDLPSHRLPANTVTMEDTLNVIMRDGWLVNRPGLEKITANLVTGRPMGATYFAVTAASKKLVIGTVSGWYALNTATSPFTWTNITGTTVLSGGSSDHVRFTVFPQGTALRLIGVNGAANQLPQYWTGSGVYAVLGGTPYAAQDISTAANRVIVFHTKEAGTVYPYRVRFSDFNDSDTWSANSFADLSDSSDYIVGGRALTRVAFAVYKENSQWIGQAQAGLFPFKFELQDQKPGPVSASAIVAVEGKHYYLAIDGSIYVFDGTRAQHVGEPARRYIANNLSFENKARAFGLYNRRDRDIWWFFPGTAASAPDQAISMNVDSGRFFAHTLRKTVTAGSEWDYQSALTWDGLASYTWDNIAATYPTWDSLGTASIPAESLCQEAGLVYAFGTATNDDGSTYTSKWRYENLQPATESKRTRVESFDTFFEKTGASQTVSTRIGTTDTLGAAPSFPAGLTDSFDISVDNLHQANYNQDAAGTGTGTPEARFITIDHTMTTATSWRWGGGHLRAYPLETES